MNFKILLLLGIIGISEVFAACNANKVTACLSINKKHECNRSYATDQNNNNYNCKWYDIAGSYSCAKGNRCN